MRMRPYPLPSDLSETRSREIIDELRRHLQKMNLDPDCNMTVEDTKVVD